MSVAKWHRAQVPMIPWSIEYFVSSAVLWVPIRPHHVRLVECDRLAGEPVHDLKAFWFLEKPAEPRAFKILLERAIRHKRALRRRDELGRELRVRGILGDLVGTAPAMQQILSIIRQVAPTNRGRLAASGIRQNLHFRVTDSALCLAAEPLDKSQGDRRNRGRFASAGPASPWSAPPHKTNSRLGRSRDTFTPASRVHGKNGAISSRYLSSRRKMVRLVH